MSDEAIGEDGSKTSGSVLLRRVILFASIHTLKHVVFRDLGSVEFSNLQKNSEWIGFKILSVRPEQSRRASVVEGIEHL